MTEVRCTDCANVVSRDLQAGVKQMSGSLFSLRHVFLAQTTLSVNWNLLIQESGRLLHNCLSRREGVRSLFSE
jgi:hypothetical protein